MKKKREACPQHFDPMASLTRMFLRFFFLIVHVRPFFFFSNGLVESGLHCL